MDKYLKAWYAEGAAYNGFLLLMKILSLMVHTKGEGLFITITGKFMSSKNFL